MLRFDGTYPVARKEAKMSRETKSGVKKSILASSKSRSVGDKSNDVDVGRLPKIPSASSRPPLSPPQSTSAQQRGSLAKVTFLQHLMKRLKESNFSGLQHR